MSSLKKLSKGATLLIICGVVVLAVIAGLVAHSLNNKPTPTNPWSAKPSETTSNPIQRSFGSLVYIGPPQYRFFDIGSDHEIVAMTDQGYFSDKVTFSGIDLASGQIIWSQSGNSQSTTGIGDSTGFALVLDGKLMLLDPATGDVRSSIDFADQSIIWAGYGYVITYKLKSSDMCVRSMTALAKCLWTAQRGSLPPRSTYSTTYVRDVFGGGKWINTGDGVRELATGKPAGFGADAGSNGGLPIAYYGPADRVVRIATLPGWENKTFQPWDTVNDKAISPAETGISVLYDAASEALVTYQTDAFEHASGSVTANLWQTGEQKWKMPYNFTTNANDQVLGDYWISNADSTLTVYDMVSGQAVWHDGSLSDLDGIQNGLIIAHNYGLIYAIDPAQDFTKVWYTEMPAHKKIDYVIVTDTMLFCVDSNDMAYLLQP